MLDNLIIRAEKPAEYNGRIVGAVYYTEAWIVDGDVTYDVVTRMVTGGKR